MSKPDPIADLHRLLKPVEAARLLSISRSTLLSLIDRENLPHVLLAGGSGARRILRFRAAELETWIGGRRERQIRGTLDGHRFARRAEGSP